MTMTLQQIQFQSSIPHYGGRDYTIPQHCPHCGITVSPYSLRASGIDYTKHEEFIFLLHKCKGCDEKFLTTHILNKNTKEIQFRSIYPPAMHTAISSTIIQFSSNFIEIFKQAHTAELENHNQLAAAGYRLALEVLVKDYAKLIQPTHLDKIKQMSLVDCAETYFPDLFALIQNDLTTVLSSDYMTYTQTCPTEFNELKYYLDIFLQNIEMKLKIRQATVPVTNEDSYT
ncbi:hypothetical protein GCM10007425_05820 [Lysinibacillus alkalisoli]|uniref:DUF4145 domain-containing protein n=1 Tax=Lysinibacillus alkalisoli TaxID=1911548 RepID=A0A917LCQ7_9BACI|nr:hypothetical protein [Lysinibacillus alkalisoli]GGG14380.1 hypothetical protein GCM10007425_05820 [Lysinibacillus alkalisoli]